MPMLTPTLMLMRMMLTLMPMQMLTPMLTDADA
jgi:hypothetical protein